ncbi:hypothetical protein L218DRAFT_898215 [Marasmius fiardii PR-910]|nr:hypothetical protein L218DRAFT_898215 [Marasmius fiardii PR-910]
MAGFLRKKSKIESPVKTKSQSARPIEPTTDNPPLTPLFARYGTGQANEGSSQKKLVVSSPMTLSSRRESTSPTKRNVSAGQSMQYGAVGREGNGIAGMSSSHEREKATRMSRSVSAQSPGGIQNGPSSPHSSNIEKPLPHIIPVESASKFSPSNRVQNVIPSTASSIATSPRKNPGLADPEPRSTNVKPSSTPNSPSPVNRNSTVRVVVIPHNPDKTGNKNTVHISHKLSAKDLHHKQTDMLQSNNDNNGFHDHSSALTSLTPLSGPRDQSTASDITSPDDFNTWLHSQSFVDAPILPDTQGVFSSSPSEKSLQPPSASYETVGSPQPASDLPLRGKPLIFSAMASVNSEPPPPPPPIKPSMNISSPHQADFSKSYPSPPSEHTPFQGQRNIPQAQSSYLQSPHNRFDSDSPRRQSLVSSRSRPPTASNTSENPPQPPLHKSSSQVSPQRARKTSLTGRPIEASSRTLTKPRPITPTKRPTTPKHRPLTPVSPDGAKQKAEVSTDLNNGGILSGVFVDDDPFAKIQGVRMLQPSSVPRDDDVSRGHSPPQGPESNPQSISPSIPSDSFRDALIQQNDPIPVNDVSQLTRPSTGQSSIERPQENKDIVEEQVVNNETNRTTTPPPPSSIPQDDAPPSPSSTERYRSARTKRRGDRLTKEAPAEVKQLPLKEDRPAEPFPLPLFLAEPALLSSLLSYLYFYEWCMLLSLSKGVRSALLETPQLKEAVLERFLDTVGYSRWTWPDPEPLTLTIGDLHDYMRGVSLPTHEYARVSALVLKAKSGHSSQIDDSVPENAQQMIECTRAYNRVLLRLRAQAEKELTNPSFSPSSFREPSRSGRMYPGSQPSSRAPSPTRSSHSHGNTQNQQPPLPVVSLPSSAGRSPLFRLRRAPLLRVFVPSPEGDWLSDDSVLKCEAELDCAGIRNLIRFGDVVWDIAVGDEGNVGRMIWDGKYLIDLDYTYSTVGDLPKYIPALAFPPSYFHRVIRTGPASSNPVVRMDLTPWGMEIASNLQLLQDRVRTETPQGAYHNVVRWVHRSSFVIRPPAGGSSHSHGKRSASRSRPNRIPIPESNHLFVDPGWYGTIVVETEGTNESLADLQERCGPGAFPPRATGGASASTPSGKEREKDSKLVYRIIRERSRPGEIWIRAASAKERLM